MNILLMITLSIVVLIIAFIIYYTLMTNTVKKERFESDKKPALRVMLFYATWCPHCERFLESGKYDEYEQTLGKDGNVVFVKYDYDKNKSIGDQYNVSSFPTIIAVDAKDKVYRFHGDRNNIEDMTKFVKAALSGESVQRSAY